MWVGVFFLNTVYIDHTSSVITVQWMWIIDWSRQDGVQQSWFSVHALCVNSTFIVFRSSWLQSKLEPDRIEYDGVYSPYRMRDWLLANVWVCCSTSDLVAVVKVTHHTNDFLRSRGDTRQYSHVTVTLQSKPATWLAEC